MSAATSLFLLSANLASTQQQEKQQQPPVNEIQSDSDTESIGEKQNVTLERQPRGNQGLQQQQQQPMQMQPMQSQQSPQPMMVHNGAVRQSRIKDRPQPKETRDSSLKIKVELDLEAEVDLYARVKGDVTIGLM